MELEENSIHNFPKNFSLLRSLEKRNGESLEKMSELSENRTVGVHSEECRNVRDAGKEKEKAKKTVRMRVEEDGEDEAGIYEKGTPSEHSKTEEAFDLEDNIQLKFKVQVGDDGQVKVQIDY